MITLQYSFESLRIDYGEYSAAVRRNLIELIRAAAREFVKAAAPHVRVRTGFAHGAYAPLARVANINLPPGEPGTTPSPRGEYYYTAVGKLLKTPRRGGSFATRDKDIITQDSDGNVKFNYTIDISYFRQNDEFGHPFTTTYPPWNSYKEGLFAFYSYIQQNADKVFPQLSDFTQIIKTNVG